MAMHLTLIDTENNLERCQFFFKPNLSQNNCSEKLQYNNQ